VTDAVLLTQRSRYTLEVDSKPAQHCSLLPTFLRRPPGRRKLPPGAALAASSRAARPGLVHSAHSRRVTCTDESTSLPPTR
jgi:hypothetical protein